MYVEIQGEIRLSLTREIFLFCTWLQLCGVPKNFFRSSVRGLIVDGHADMQGATRSYR